MLQVLKYLDNLSEVEDYLKFVGRIHDCAGVDPNYLDLTGLAFCQALDNLGHHTDIWNQEVKDAWKTFFRVIVRIMKKGYAQNNLLISHHRPLSRYCSFTTGFIFNTFCGSFSICLWTQK